MRDKEEDLIERTIKLWQPYYPFQLTREDAREIIENMKAFYSLLIEWQEREDLATSAKNQQNGDLGGQHIVTLGDQEDEKN